MPIFDNELIDNVANRETPQLKGPLGSPNLIDINTNISLGTIAPKSVGTGLSISDLSKVKAPTAYTFDSPFQMVPKSELIANQRYSLYERDKDLENIYGLQQGALAKLGNGVVKMAATALGTFAQGFATIPNTVAAVKGGVKELSNPDGYEGDIDKWLKNVEDKFPNYYTRQEKEHPFLAAIPGFAGSANFWGDKVIKNIGFTVGAIGSALVQDAAVGFATEGLGEIPLLANQIGKASLWLNKIFTGTNDLEKTLDLARALGKTEKQILNIERLGQIAAAQKVNSGFRYGLNIYGSARTEAAVEARDGYRQVKEELINQYKAEHLGEEPTTEALNEIDKYATNAMNTRFGINMALLTVSNALQFDNLFKSVTSASASRGVTSGLVKEIEEAGKIGLKEGSLDVFEKKVPKTFMGKVWESVKPKAANIFTEGVYEEGGQYAAERGTYDYYTRKYRAFQNPETRKNWNDLNEVIDSTTKGLADQFNTVEGIENMLVGGISAAITGGIMKGVDRIKGQGKDARLQASINLLNQYGLTGILHEKYTDTLNSVNIARQMKQAAMSNNVFAYNNLKSDMFFGFVRSRSAAGMHDVTVEQLNMLKDLSKDEFEKTFGMSFDESNQKTVNDYVDKLISKANEIDKTYKSIDSTFKNVFTFTNDPKTAEEQEENNNFNTFNAWKTNLAYLASVRTDTKYRLSDIQEQLLKINPLLNNDVVSDFSNRDSLKEISDKYEEQANSLTKTITDQTPYADKKAIMQKVKSFRTMSEKINLALNNGNMDIKTFGELLNFELNNNDVKKDPVIPVDKLSDIHSFAYDINQLNRRDKDASNAFDVLSSKEGFEKFFKDENDLAEKEMKEQQEKEDFESKPLPEFTNVGGVKEAVQIGREYLAQPKKKSKVRKLAADRFKVTDPDGKVSFYPTREKAIEAAADIDLGYQELSKVKVLAVNPDGTVKVEDNEGNIQNISLDRLTGYEKIMSEQEKLQKFAEQFENDQKDIENNSGEVGTGESDKETIPMENPAKDAKILFLSSSTESEEWEDPLLSPAHIKRARTFLNKAKTFANRSNLRAILVTPNQAASLGLNGIVQMSYKVDPSTKVEDIPGALSVEDGFVAQVFVEQDGANVYFVNEKGERIGKIGEQVDLDKVVFQTMPTTSLLNSRNNPRYRSNQKEEAERYSAAWKIERERLFANPEGSYKLYSFTISRGIPVEIKDANGRLERNPVSDVLISEDLIGSQEGLIKISVEGSLSHNGQSLNFPKGRPIFQYGDTFVPLNNRKFTSKEATTIFQVIKELANDGIRQSKLPGQPQIRLNRKLSTFLQGTLFWKTRKGITENKNNFYIDTQEMNIYLGGKAYDMTKIGDFEKEIIDHLKETYNNVNNEGVTKNFSEEFVEYRYENGKLEQVEWPNYQTYLLSSTEPDGSTRGTENIPLVTSVSKISDGVPNNFQQKYSILDDLELPLALVPKVEKVTSTPEGVVVIDGFKMDNTTKHTYTGFQLGPVEFTGKVTQEKDEKGNPINVVDVKIISGDTTKTASKNKDLITKTVIPELKNIQGENFNAAASDEELLMDYLAFVLSSRLKLKLDESQKEEIETPETTTTSGIEISSNVKGFGAVLTNPTELAKKKGNLTKSYPVTFEGKTYKDAEEAYQENKGKYTKSGRGPGSTYELMIKILTAKLQQHPEIVNEITKQGGSKWLLASRHQPTNKNSVWETGGQNWFILALNDAYQDILTGKPTATVSDIKAKKAELEKNKNEELKQLDNLKNGDEVTYFKKNGGFTKAIVTDFDNGEFNLSYTNENEELRPAGPGGIYNTTFVQAAIIEKYKEELAALEGTKPAGYNPKNTKKRDDEDEFRRQAKRGEKKGRITDAELIIFKEWAAKNVPQIPYEILEEIITTHDNEKAWGVYQDGIAKFYRGGLKGTQYHEIFEGIWKHLLTEDERKAIIDEFRTKAGKFTDRASGRKYSYDDPMVSDRMIKERIADDFADFRDGKVPAKTLGQKIVQFFRRIIEFVKSFINKKLGKTSLKEDLFKAIDAGKLKDRVSTVSTNETPEYRAVENLTEQQTYEFIQDMLAMSAKIIFGENDVKALFEINSVTSTELFDKIKARYANEGKIDEMGETAWKQLVQRTKESLRALGVSFNDQDRVNINDENVNNRDYAPEPFSTDWKKYSYFPVKILVATLIETQPRKDGDFSKLPKPKTTSIEGYQLVNFSKAFATLLDKLSNTTNTNEFIKKLVDLVKEDGNYALLFKRLGGDLKTMTIDFSKFKPENWRMFTQFIQTFSKQKPQAIVQYIRDTQVYSGSAALTGAVNTLVRSWIENIKGASKAKDSIVKYNSSEKLYKVEGLKDVPVKEIDDKLKFLSKLGIEFPMETFLKLNPNDKNTFGAIVTKIHTYLDKANNIYSVTNKTLDVNNYFEKLAELYVKAENPIQDTTHFNIDGNRTNSFAENNAPSVFENEFNECKTLKELLSNRPELKDVFSTSSLLLKKGGVFFDNKGNRTGTKLKIGYIGGTININTDKGTSTSKLNVGDRYTQEINQNLNGNYYILIPADSSTEWMINLGNAVKFADVESEKDGWNKTFKIFRGYLNDEIDLALDYNNRKNVKNIKANGKRLRFFNEILEGQVLKDISNMLINGSTKTEIEKYITDNIDTINASIKKYIQDTVDITRKNLTKAGKIRQVDENTFSYLELDENFELDNELNKFNLTDKLVNDILTFANINYVINNIEMHKVIFGDPYQFKITKENGKVILDETKRLKSFLSPRRTTFTSPELRTFLNEEFNKTGIFGEEGRIKLEPGDPGYHQHKAYASTVTARDVKVAGSLRRLSNAFLGYKETDGASWMMINSYREVKNNNGQWGEDGEKWYQWQSAYARQKMSEKGTYTYPNDKRGEALKKHDAELITKPEPKFVLDVLKPIVSGVKYNKSKIDMVLDKFSQMPIYYKAVEGTNLETLFTKMHNEKKDYIIVESGRKVGTEELHDIYNSDGTFNDEAFNNEIQVPWKAYGIQVENSYEGPGQQTRGSQVTKIASMDLFENGEPATKDPERAKVIKAAITRNNRALDNLHTNAYFTLLKKLGIEDLGTSFELIDKSAISETLEHEMLRRALSQNAKDTIQLLDGEFRIPFEASTSYRQIKDIIYSIIDKSLISPKMNGGAHVQVPVTMWENASEGRRVAVKKEDKYEVVSREEFESLPDDIKETAILTDDTLKFYSEDNPYCEIMLPHWFKEKINTKRFPNDEALIKYLNTSDEGKAILRGIGFRIPSQATSSIEAVRIKGFLPQSMGKTVVVPSELVAKSGSDFDIDKLNMYLKSVYVDENGDILLVRWRGNEEATRAFYEDVYNTTIQAEFDKIEKGDEFRASLVNIFEKIEALENPNIDSIKGTLNEDEYKFYERHINIIRQIRDQAADEEINPSEYLYGQIEKLSEKKNALTAEQLNEKLKEKFVDDMYKRALENEYYDSLEEIITMPEIFDRLMSPVGDDGLSELASRIDKLKGYDESNIRNRMLDRNYLTNLRHAFVSAKRWIGIAAVNITHHALCQKTKVYVDTRRFDFVSDQDQKILGDGIITLPHNTVNIDGQDFISLSGRLDSEGKFISDGLSGFATAFVDVAKDPYIIKILKNESVVGMFMFMRRIGISRDNIGMFMNQPIIEEYLNLMERVGTKNLFNATNISFIKGMFSDTSANEEDRKVNTKSFEDNIENYYKNGKLDPKANSEQQAIFDEFLKIAKMADYNFKLSQASNYDTTKFKSGDTLFLKQVRTALARQTNIISSVDDILSSSFIGYQSLLLDYAMESVGEIVKLEKDEFRNITDELLRSYAENYYMSMDDYEKIANRIKSSFLDYIIQTKSNISDQIKRLLVDGSDLIVERLTKAKKEHPEIDILKELIPASSPRIDGAKSIELKANIKDSFDEDRYTGMMREMRDSGIPGMRQLYNDIVTLSILQGSYQSSISIKNIIPLEDYSKTIKDIIDPLVADIDVQNFKKGAFQRNNWKDDLIFAEYTPRFYQLEDPVDFDPISEEDIYLHKSFAFPDNKTLGITSTQRQIMFISDRSFVSNKDYIKVPRAIQLKDDNGKPLDSWVDMRTGESIFKSDFAIRRKRGDLALQNYYGYERVKYEDGTPLTVTNAKGYTSYVYKLINLLGDGQYASEYYLDNRPSVIDNGTVKVEKELNNSDIIKALLPETEETKADVASPTSVANTITPEETVSGEREYTPENLSKANMPANGIFVFGSNTEGRHGKGAAETAKKEFGAIQGQAEGLQGKSYAIITKDLAKGERSIPLYNLEGTSIADGVRDFIEFANAHPELKFYVTKLGSKLAGYTVEEIKDIFKAVNDLYLSQDIQNYIPDNVILPREYEVRTEKKSSVKEMQLRDGITYQSADINGTMLENMGYSPLEIANILNQIC